MPLSLRKSNKIIGMIHIQALPGTPGYCGDMDRILEKAAMEAKIYQEAGVDMIALENMHDVPYLNREVGPEIVAAMTRAACEVKQAAAMPCGIQVLAGANKAALAVALAAGLDFVRVEGFVFGHLSDEGWMNSDAGELMRYRKAIGAQHIPVFADIKKKHSAHAMSADVSIEETAKAAQFFLTDGVIVTGPSTGRAVDSSELERVRGAVDIPVLVGSGVTPDNVLECMKYADALIVGSWFKRDGFWANEVDPERVRIFMKKVKVHRNH